MRAPKNTAVKTNSIKLEEALSAKTQEDVVTIDSTDLSQSPLNSQPVVEKDYTNRQAAPQAPAAEVAQTTPAPAPASITPPFQEDLGGYSTELPPEYAHLADVPEQPIASVNPGQVSPAGPTPINGEAPKAEGSETIDKVMEQGSESLADTALSVYETLIPGVIDQFISVKTRSYKDFVNSGDLSPLVLDDIKSRNKENLVLLKTRAKEDSKMMEKPLKKLLVKSGIQVPPQWELAVVFGIILIMNFFLIKEIKKDNEAMESRILNTVRDKKETERKSTLATIVEDKKNDSPKQN